MPKYKFVTKRPVEVVGLDGRVDGGVELGTIRTDCDVAGLMNLVSFGAIAIEPIDSDADDSDSDSDSGGEPVPCVIDETSVEPVAGQQLPAEPAADPLPPIPEPGVGAADSAETPVTDKPRRSRARKPATAKPDA